MIAAPAKRTQRERREETIAKLVQATIDCLLEVGYAGTTVSEICKRAGVSHGGLFRHFGTVIELVVAAADEVGRRQLAEFEARFARAPRGKRPILSALRLLRDACRAPINTVFYELLVAARTDRDLRRALEPNLRRYHEAILEGARKVPEIRGVPEELLEPLLFSLVHLFDGESLVHVVLDRPKVDEQRLHLLATMVESVAGRVS